MFRFQNPCSFLLCGPSSSGKTQFIFRLIEHLPKMCADLKGVCYFYDTWQSSFEPLMDRVTFKRGIPSLDDLKQAERHLVVLDDLMGECGNAIFSKMFTVYSHHLHFSVVLTAQNLYNKNLREISLNAQVVVLFKNVRDSNQIACFFRQVYPKKSRQVLDCYKDAVREPFSYLLVDLRQDTHDSERLRAKIFPDDQQHFVCQ